jgi:glycosyltransferase involved in cell wall biosynthesis
MTGSQDIRVLSVIGNLMVGGTESYVARMAREIRKYGVDMEICALELEGPLLKSLEESGVRVHGTPYANRIRQSNTLTLIRTVSAIRRIVAEGRFDIVHTYLFWSDVLGVGGARLAGCRRVIESRRSLHGWTHSPSAFFHGLEQVTNLFANEVIANSRVALLDAEAHEPWLPRIRSVLYNGVDVEDYTPAPPRYDGPLRIVTLGVLAPRKGQEFAIEALAILIRSGVDATLALVGSGPDEPMLRHRVLDAGIGDRVTFAGEQLDPRPYLAGADLFLLPSRQEGFSNALLEAMATSLPVVATDVGGNAEAFIDGEGGRLVPPHQPAAMAAAIAELAKDRSRLAEMGRANRQRVAELYTLEASARNLAGWYLGGPATLTV